jgi:L-ascorbate metabolism protein UlaG (beta-lactamase superfamily)
MAGLVVTWLGHSTFLLQSPGGRRIVFDPWLKDNPACPADRKQIDAADMVLVSHGHFDHTGDLVPVARATGALVIGTFELSQWAAGKGIERVSGMNKGGSQEVHGIRVSMVHAVHTSSVTEGDQIVYLGEPVGYVLRFEDGLTVYYAGDTALFGDMALIKDLHAPSLAFLPIGDFYTMGPDAAARACALLGVRRVIPMHYGTFPALAGTPARLRELVAPAGVEVIELQPGSSVTISPVPLA